MADCARAYYCYTLPEYTVGGTCDTPEYYPGGILAIGVLRCGTEVTDPSNGTELQTLIDDGALTIIKSVKASLDEPSAVTIDPVTACGSQITINADRTVTLNDAKVSKTIIEFYNDMLSSNGMKLGGLLLYECGPVVKRVSYVNAEVSFFGGRNIPLTSAEGQSFNGTFSWRTPLDPVPYDAPDNIFE